MSTQIGAVNVAADKLEETMNFFVDSKLRESDKKLSWLVYRRSLTVCVDAASEVNAAVTKAIRMAEFCTLGGQAAQVHLRERQDTPWRIIWSKNAQVPSRR